MDVSTLGVSPVPAASPTARVAFFSGPSGELWLHVLPDVYVDLHPTTWLDPRHQLIAHLIPDHDKFASYIALYGSFTSFTELVQDLEDEDYNLVVDPRRELTEKRLLPMQAFYTIDDPAYMAILLRLFGRAPELRGIAAEISLIMGEAQAPKELVQLTLQELMKVERNRLFRQGVVVSVPIDWLRIVKV
jgi:hypothetical protein